MTTINKISKRSTAGIKIALALVAVCVSANSFARDVAPVEAPTLVKPKLATVSPRSLSVGTAICIPKIVGTTGYSEVFKGCDPANTAVALYYGKTECVRDNATGLIWQGQTLAGTGLRANDQFKTNFDDITKPQKWVSNNTYVNPTQAEVDAITNTIGYKTAVNATNLCGFNNWRLPTINELLTIHKPPPTPSMSVLYIDLPSFPNTVGNKYWSSDVDNANPQRAHRGRAHGFVALSFGESVRYYTNELSVRLVR